MAYQQNENKLSTEEDAYLISSYTESLRQKAIKSIASQLPSDDDYFQLSTKLSKDYSKISYEQYEELRKTSIKSLQKYLKTVTFLQATKNEQGQVFSNEILMCVQRAMDVERAYLGMMAQSSHPKQLYVTEKELALFIHSMLPDIRNSREMDDEFIPYFMITSARKFFFFHDLSRYGQLNIKKLAHSSTMEELLFLRRLDKYENDLDPKIYREQLGANWFYHKNTLYLFSLFTNLDRDRNGTLSASEIMNFTGTSVESAQFTRKAAERIIDAHMSNSSVHGELDYVGFINLVLAIENKTSIASLLYFWKVLDVFDTGRLTERAIEYFYRDIYSALRREDFPAAPSSVIVGEVFDILGCNDPEGVTFEEFKSCGQGHTVASILLDAACFMVYENREMQANSQSSDPEDDN